MQCLSLAIATLHYMLHLIDWLVCGSVKQIGKKVTITFATPQHAIILIFGGSCLLYTKDTKAGMDMPGKDVP